MPVLPVEGAEINYETHGDGPPLMFLSATAWHGGIWKLHQVAHFSRDHRVIIFDQRGTGRSTVSSTDFSTGRLAKDAIALLDHLGIRRTSVCGHSNGGRIAQLLALDHPDRIDRLVLASAGATHTSKGIPLGMCLALVENGLSVWLPRASDRHRLPQQGPWRSTPTKSSRCCGSFSTT